MNQVIILYDFRRYYRRFDEQLASMRVKVINSSTWLSGVSEDPTLGVQDFYSQVYQLSDIRTS